MFLKMLMLVFYAAVIIAIGIISSRKVRSFTDYFLGGGKVGAWMTAFTYGAAYFSAVLFIGFAGKIGWIFGYSGLWIAVGNSLIGVLAVWWILGEKIKNMSVEYQVTTMPEFFEKRYGSKFLKLFSSISIFLFFIPYSAAVFIGLAYLFKANFNLEYWHALAFMGAFTAFYLVCGGYRSMVIVDMFFGILMVLGSLILVTSTLVKGNGLSNITAGLSAIDPKLTQVIGPPGLWPLFSLVFLTSVAPFAMPQLIQKFYAVRDRKAIRFGMIASTVFAILISFTAYFIGPAARFFLSPEKNPGAFLDGKPIFDALMPEFFANVVPHGLSTIILILVLSASMSTLAALVLISSSSLAKDLYSGFISKNADDKTLTLLMRIFNALFVVISVILAYFKPATIVSILGIAWGAIGAVFLGPFIWGLLTKRANKAGAIASSILGLGTCIILYMKGMSTPEAGTIGMIVSLAVNPLVSLIIKDKLQMEAQVSDR